MHRSSGSRVGWYLVGAFVFVSLALACGSGAGGGGGGGGDAVTTATGSPTPFAHPTGYAAPTMHGYDLENSVLDCRQCHGAQLDGGTSAIGCDGCHTAGWRTNCVYCHGGTDNQTGAPPRELAGSTTASFNVHTKHVTADTVHKAYDCNQCHQKPTGVLTTGHMFDGTPGRAEVVFSFGVSAYGSYLGGQQCQNLWCHGNGQGDTGTYSGQQAPTTCSSCHHGSDGVYGPMTGFHDTHMVNHAPASCSGCHPNTNQNGTSLTSNANHINRLVELSMGATSWNAGTRVCSGGCHNSPRGW